jgi:hypothetical protein
VNLDGTSVTPDVANLVGAIEEQIMKKLFDDQSRNDVLKDTAVRIRNLTTPVLE